MTKSISSHAADRMIERNISSETVKSILTNPTSNYPGNKPGTHCVQGQNIRMVYSDNGNIITAVKL